MSATATLAGARADPDLAVLEGFHAVKHALRFGAAIEAAVTPNRAALDRLARALAPDLRDRLAATFVEVSAATWREVAPRGLPSPALAVARRPRVDVGEVLGTAGGPVVLLEAPTHLGNLGAVVRVAAAAGADGVVTTGDVDPWHPTAVRAAAGLHFALPVARLGAQPAAAPIGPRPLVAVDPNGEPLGRQRLPRHGVFAFGTERGGLSDGLKAAADATVRIPMRAGVSSLNLATAVAVVLYAGFGPGR